MTIRRLIEFLNPDVHIIANDWQKNTACLFRLELPIQHSHLSWLQSILPLRSACCGNMSNNINSGGRRNALSSVDFYRRVPKDLTEVSSSRLSSATRFLVLELRRMSIRKFLVRNSQRLGFLLPPGNDFGCSHVRGSYGNHVNSIF